jgi:3-hydroxybutyryl-CoA dehydrogenase
MPEDVALARVGCEGVLWSRSAGDAADGAHLVVESLPEELELKQRELAEAQEASPLAILATNTSSLRIREIAAALSDPTRLVGTHFFNPPSAFRVVELVAGDGTDPAVIDEMDSILCSLGKAPVRVGDVPGFVVNRLQFALLREAIELVDTGVVEPADLDRLVVEGLGCRWTAAGPLATVALGGAELFHRIAVALYPHLSRRAEPPAELARLCLSDDELEILRARRDRILAVAAPEPDSAHIGTRAGGP